MKICWDNLENLVYLKNGVWKRISDKNTSYYYIEMLSCDKCGEPYLTDRYIPKNYCSRSCSMVGKMVGEDNPFYGKTHTEEIRELLRIKNSGVNAPMYGKKHTEISKIKMSENQLGSKNSFYGKFHTEETKSCISIKGSGENHYLFGKHLSEQTKKKISENRKGKLKGAESPVWRGGVTPERQGFYISEEWRNVCSKVWKRDAATCQLCGKLRISSEPSHHIHHIIPFYVKELRSNIDNLILLCKPCHIWIHSKKNVGKVLIGEA